MGSMIIVMVPWMRAHAMTAMRVQKIIVPAPKAVSIRRSRVSGVTTEMLARLAMVAVMVHVREKRCYVRMATSAQPINAMQSLGVPFLRWETPAMMAKRVPLVITARPERVCRESGWLVMTAMSARPIVATRKRVVPTYRQRDLAMMGMPARKVTGVWLAAAKPQGS